MTALLLAALLAQASDGGVEQLYEKCGDAPLVVPVDGGYFTPESRQRRENCRAAACEAFASAKLAEAPPATSTSPTLVLGVVGGGLALLAVAVAVGYLLPHPAR